MRKVSFGPITKTCLYNFDPLKPHFYIVKLGFTGVYIIFLISAQKHGLWYLLEPPRRGGSNEYPQSMFWAEIWKISEFLSDFCHFLVVKFSVYFNRRVFVMRHSLHSYILQANLGLYCRHMPENVFAWRGPLVIEYACIIKLYRETIK